MVEVEETEIIKIHGLPKKRWRCPECTRGLTNNIYCLVHGSQEQLVDLLSLDESEIKKTIFWAIGVDIHERYNYHPPFSISMSELERNTGIEREYLQEFLNTEVHKDYEWGRGQTYQEALEESNKIKIVNF